MQCQAAARCSKKVNPAGSLAVKEAWLAAMVRVQDHLTLISSLSLSVSQCTILWPCALRCLFSSNQVAEGVCVWICVCLNTLHRLRTYLREKEKEADTDREAEPGCCKRVSPSARRGERYLRRILTLRSWMGLWEQNPDSSWGRKHIPILLELFLWLGRQIVQTPPAPPHTLYVSGWRRGLHWMAGLWELALLSPTNLLSSEIVCNLLTPCIDTHTQTPHSSGSPHSWRYSGTTDEHRKWSCSARMEKKG